MTDKNQLESVDKCCACAKPVNPKEPVIPPTAYGLYTGGRLSRVICADCIKKPENKNWWKE
jgi:hypothetical protein